MENLRFALEGAWQVLLVGLVLGAGLPAVFAVGIRSLAYGVGGTDSPATSGHDGPHPWSTVLAGLCLLIVVAGVVLGITFVVASGFGKALDFSHVYPTLVDKA